MSNSESSARASREVGAGRRGTLDGYFLADGPGLREDPRHKPGRALEPTTILGAVLFLRFGYAVGNVGMVGGLLIVLIGHLVTLPTALALSEIATNRKVEGGGEYFIISRSFGRSIGGTIGIGLYVSQAISIAFYMIAR